MHVRRKSRSALSRWTNCPDAQAVAAAEDEIGTRDLFLSNAVRLHRALCRAQVPTELHVFEGMPHGGFMGAPEDLEPSGEIARFVRSHLRARG